MKVVKPGPDRETPRGVVGGSEISQATAGASNIYMGVFRVPAGAQSRPHYHAGCESAVVGLTKTLAKEWGQFKVNVNAVAFGYIETRLTASKVEHNVMEIGGEKVQLGIPDQLRGMASMLIPLGRPGTPEEAAGGVFFLCSPWSNFVHGQVLNITGGQFTGMTT